MGNNANKMIKKQVLLDGKALDAYNLLQQRVLFIRDSHLLRAALILAAEASEEEFKRACKEAVLIVGRPKEKKCPAEPHIAN